MPEPVRDDPSRAPVAVAPSLTVGRNVYALAAVSFFTDVASEMIYPLLPLFLTGVLGASAGFVGAIEGAAESTAALLKLASGWWSDRVRRRKPLIVAGYAIASIVRPLIAFARAPVDVLLVRLSDRVGKGIRNSPRDALIADSVDPAIRGRAFGIHRAADNFGAVVGPIVAYLLLRDGRVAMRDVFLLAAIPGALSLLTVLLAVREVPREPTSGNAVRPDVAPRDAGALGTRFWAVLAVIFVFTLGNSTDAFLLLRARQLGVPVALAPILWAWLHVVKSASGVPGGILSDRVGRKPALVAGWLVYAATYLAFARAGAAWQAWALFGVYGLFFGLTEGAERALVADLVPRERRGAAYGWYYLAIGVAALPASLVFGILWDRAGAPTAFALGAALALASAVGLAAVPLGRRASPAAGRPAG